MPCNHVKLPGGGALIIHYRTTRKRCLYCDRPSEILCDFHDPANKSGTCDKPCCRLCSKRVGPDRDYCEGHAKGDTA
jgi:hypothetical protein